MAIINANKKPVYDEQKENEIDEVKIEEAKWAKDVMIER